MADSFYSSVNQESFKLPDMGEYYDVDLIEEFMNKIKNEKNEDAKYFIEEPFSTELGYHSDYEAFVIKAIPQIPKYDDDKTKIGKKNADLNILDGDTMYFNISSIAAGDGSFIVKGKEYKNFQDYIYAHSNPERYNCDSFILRSVGIDCPEIVHYGLVPYSKKDYESKKNIVKMTIGQVKKENLNIIYDESIIRDDNTEAEFLYYDNAKTKLVEIIGGFNQNNKYNSGSRSQEFTELYFNTRTEASTTDHILNDTNKENGYLKIVTSCNIEDRTLKDGNKAKDIYIDLLSNATDIRIVVDANQIQWEGYAKGPFKIDYGIFSLSGMWEYICSQWLRLFGDEVYKYAGFNAFGQDAYKRFLGTVYVKTKLVDGESEVWINTAKYIKAKLGESVKLSLGTMPSTMYNNNNLSKAFKLWTYDSSKYKYIDAYNELSADDTDDRIKIQNSIVGYDYELCKEYTVIIGDCLFMIPPTMIREVTQSDSTRIQLLRSKGTMVKQKPNNEKSLQLTLYFNGDKGINGYPIIAELPNGSRRTYYMNGLRSLIAMFKLTPYLPIENEYINNTLNIDAVTLQSISIQTMKSYPKCLAVNLILQNFNYRTFLTELPIPNPEKGEKFNKNMFSTTINYEVMRYYYQSPLIRGESLKNYGRLSDDYIHMTLGNRTSLIPIQFKTDIIKFYILDENWLNTLLSIKKLSAKQTVKQFYAINEATEEWAKKTGLDLAKAFSILKKYHTFINLEDKNASDWTIGSSSDMEDWSKRRELQNDLVYKIIENNNMNNLTDVYFTQDKPFSIILRFNLNNISSDEFKNLIKAISIQLDLDQNKEIDFKNGELKLNLKKDKELEIIDKGTQAFQIAEFFIYRSGKTDDNTDLEEVDTEDWGKFTTNINNELMTEAKDKAIDIDSTLSAKFVEYPLEILPTDVVISMENVFSNTKLKAYDGYAPQYCGGQDTVMEITFQTRSKESVQALTTLQSIATNDLIKYRQVINCWPIRIDSEIAQLCGVNEVLIESIDTSTVPNYPNLYNITVRLISVDRTMRNKEALKKLDTINNAGAINPSGISNVVTKTYFDLSNTLAKTEVYPDLELPTIQELEEIGFRFIKYTFNKGSRIYPDPDFYFVYAYVYNSQMIRKMIIDYFENLKSPNSDDINFMFCDDNSKQKVYLNMLNNNEQYSFEYADKDLAKEYEERVKKISKELSKIEVKDDKELKAITQVRNDIQKTYKNISEIENEIFTNISEAWKICPDVKCYIGNIGFNYSSENEVTKKIDKAKDKIIRLINEYLRKPIDSSFAKGTIEPYDYFSTFTNRCYEHFRVRTNNKWEENNIWLKIFNICGVFKNNEPNSQQDTYDDAVCKRSFNFIGKLYACAAAALSGASEYSEDLDEGSYEPRGRILLYKKISQDYTEKRGPSHNLSDSVPFVKILDKDTKETFIATSEEQAMKYGISFGIYQIRKYDKTYLNMFYKNLGLQKIENMDFIDPYYNKEIHKKLYNENLFDEEYEEYKKNICSYSDYAIEAFNRIVLLWVKKLLEDKLFINYIEFNRNEIVEKYKKLLVDMFSNVDKETKKENNTANTIIGILDTVATIGGLPVHFDDWKKDHLEQMDNIEEAVNKYVEDMKEKLTKNDHATIAGKVFLAITCAVTNGDSYIYEDLINHNISSLNSKVSSAVIPMDLDSNISEAERIFRKLIRIMCCKNINLAKNFGKIATASKSSLEETYNDSVEKLWVSASNDPSLWIMHSFYDMVTTNKRGRMARAFPTYYMLLVDEGREIGYWKLHDNFYNINSIAEMQITKSRKIPADVAKVTMTNLYKTYTTDDEDIRTDYENNLTDAFNSIFNPHKYFEKAESKRNQQLNINKIKLKPGVRVHIRMGYSGDASSLPIVFNGVIAEVTTGELIQFVAQGDGAELSNPDVFSSLSAKDVSQIKNENDFVMPKWIENFFDDGDTPKGLLKNILTQKGGSFTKTMINWITDGRFFNDNMFGVVNFGEIDYKELHSNGEVMQNIYEAEGGMPWTQSEDIGTTAYYHNEISPPKFTIDLIDKSVWDILNICANCSLDYIGAIAPFGLRSTIFLGRPHYYYAYDYMKDSNGKIYEKRKPYSQYHIISSYNDIIGNNIIASSSDIRTCGIGIYKGPNMINKKVEKKLEQIWVDFDIYPEFQKTITVDTGITYKGPKLGFLVYNWYQDSFSVNGGQKLAWRITARALKDSIKDMYQGEVVILGDSSIKPYDRIYLQDIYEDMNGSFEVEAVVINMSVENGFTTSIYPDCISTIDNRFEQIGQMVSKNIIGQALMVQGALYTSNRLFETSTKPILGIISKTVKKGATLSVNGINKISNFIAEKDLIEYSKLEKWSNKFYAAMGISETQLKLYDMVNYMSKFKDHISKIKTSNLNNLDDVYRILKNVVDTESKIDFSTMATELKALKENNKVNSSYYSYIDDFIKAIEKNYNAEGIKELLKKSGSTVVNSIKDTTKLTSEELKCVENINKYLSKEALSLDDSKALVKEIGSILNKTDDLYENKTFVESIVKYNDDLVDVIKTIDAASDMSKLKSVVMSTAFLTNLATKILTMGVELLIEYCLTKSVYNWIENKLASFNVLQIYPLRKNGVVYIAGLDGHKGLVVGSPTYNKQGLIDQFVSWVFRDRGPVLDFVREMFVSDNMRKILDTYYKNNKYGEYLGSTGESEYTLNDMIASIAEKEMTTYSAYRSLAMSKRISDLKSEAASTAFHKCHIPVENLASNSIVNGELVPITRENTLLKEYFDNGSLKTIHEIEYKMDNSYKADDPVAFNKTSYTFNTKQSGKVKVFGIDIGDKNNHLIDIPFLRIDAFQVLLKILTDIQVSEKEQAPGENKNPTLYLLSGTVAGANKWNSTGYIFKIYVSNYDILEQKLNLIKNELQEAYIGNQDDVKEGLLQYKKYDNGNFDIFVSPRVTSSN